MRMLHRAGALLLLCILAGLGMSQAQTTNTRLELARASTDGRLVLHLMVPRGQTIDSATLRSGVNTISLEADPLPLPLTRWVVLDASSSMVNLQPAIQSALTRFLTNREGRSGIITYDSAVRVLRPTTRQADIDDFLTDYNATANEPGCLADALERIVMTERDVNRAWRILLITGPLSRQTICTERRLPTLPAPIDIIVVSDQVDDALADLVERSGGSIMTGNLRTIEARINEVNTLWSQPSFALNGRIEGSPGERDTLEVVLANGLTEQTPLRFTIQAAPQASPQATSPNLATIPPRPTDTPAPTQTEPPPTAQPSATPTEQGEAAIIAPPLDPAPTTAAPASGPAPGAPDSSNLIILGLGAVALVLLLLGFVLWRRRPQPDPEPGHHSGNFYQSISSPGTATPKGLVVPGQPVGPPRKGNFGETIMEKLVGPGAAPVSTRRLDKEDPAATPALNGGVLAEQDEALLTQVLTDSQFRRMMNDDQASEEVVAWLRLDGGSQRDFALKRTGALLGRGVDCEIIVRDDPAISRQHARLSVNSAGMVMLTRLSLTNPIIVGGVYVVNDHILQPNDVIHLSDRTRLIFIARQPDTGDDGAFIDDETLL